MSEEMLFGLMLGAFVGLFAGVQWGIWLAECRVRWIAEFVGSKKPSVPNVAGEIVRCMESRDWFAAAGDAVKAMPEGK